MNLKIKISILSRILSRFFQMKLKLVFMYINKTKINEMMYQEGNICLKQSIDIIVINTIIIIIKIIRILQFKNPLLRSV